MPVYLLLVCDDCGQATPSRKLGMDMQSVDAVTLALGSTIGKMRCPECLGAAEMGRVAKRMGVPAEHIAGGGVIAADLFASIVAANATADETRAAQRAGRAVSTDDAMAAIKKARP